MVWIWILDMYDKIILNVNIYNKNISQQKGEKKQLIFLAWQLKKKKEGIATAMNHLLKGWFTLIQFQRGALYFIFFLFSWNIIGCYERHPTRQWFIAKENKPTVTVLEKRCRYKWEYN